MILSQNCAAVDPLFPFVTHCFLNCKDQRCLPRQCTRIVGALYYIAQCGSGRNKECDPFELASDSGPFWARLAELCVVAHFLLHAG